MATASEPSPDPGATTLIAALDRAAAANPSAAAYFHSEGETLTYPDLVTRSTALAQELLRRGVRTGDPVGILAPNAPEFLTGFFGAARAGAQACPLALPLGRRGTAAFLYRLRRIAGLANLRVLLLSHRMEAFAEALHAELPQLDVVLTSPDDRPPDPAGLPRLHPAQPVMTQFTSGSTADPKGVRLSHANVLAGLASIRQGIQLGPADAGGFWIPLFHDMGLFGTLSAITTGIDVHLWSPAAFARRPATWLREFLASGATITAMPDFGYDQLVATISPDEVPDLRMGHWRLAMNGAEPVSFRSVDAFTRHFAPAGFRPEAMFPVYGMAEAVLAVTFPPLGRRPVFDWVDRQRLSDRNAAVPLTPDVPGTRAVAGVGRPVTGLELRVSDPENASSCPDEVVGEIQIRGAAVMSGYLTGSASSEVTGDGWLHTGDLGYRRDGEVFVTGRIKEMITVHGRNFYPQDVEALARDVPGVSRGRCVATTDLAPDGTEQILLVAETSRSGPEADDLAAALRRRISEVLNLGSVSVHLVAPHALPRTSSGKYQRNRARALARSTGPAEIPAG